MRQAGSPMLAIGLRINPYEHRCHSRGRKVREGAPDDRAHPRAYRVPDHVPRAAAAGAESAGAGRHTLLHHSLLALRGHPHPGDGHARAGPVRAAQRAGSRPERRRRPGRRRLRWLRRPGHLPVYRGVRYRPGDGHPRPRQEVRLPDTLASGGQQLDLSSVISNTTTAAMLLPIGLGMMGALGFFFNDTATTERDVSRLRFGTALMLMISYGAGVGGLLTPIGTPPNLIGIGFIEEETNIRITFFAWVLAAFPICLLMFIALCVILILLNHPEVRRISGAHEYIHEERSKLGPFLKGERNTLIVFAVALWMLPGIVALIFGDESTIYSYMYS